MDIPILFYLDKENIRKNGTPTNFGWDQMILLEDKPGRLVFLCRSFGDDEIYSPWRDQQYQVYETKGDIERFYEEHAIGNYRCDGVYDIRTDQAAGDAKRIEEVEKGDKRDGGQNKSL